MKEKFSTSNIKAKLLTPLFKKKDKDFYNSTADLSQCLECDEEFLRDGYKKVDAQLALYMLPKIMEYRVSKINENREVVLHLTNKANELGRAEVAKAISSCKIEKIATVLQINPSLKLGSEFRAEVLKKILSSSSFDFNDKNFRSFIKGLFDRLKESSMPGLTDSVIYSLKPENISKILTIITSDFHLKPAQASVVLKVVMRCDDVDFDNGLVKAQIISLVELSRRAPMKGNGFVIKDLTAPQIYKLLEIALDVIQISNESLQHIISSLLKSYDIDLNDQKLIPVIKRLWSELNGIENKTIRDALKIRIKYGLTEREMGRYYQMKEIYEKNSYNTAPWGELVKPVSVNDQSSVVQGMNASNISSSMLEDEESINDSADTEKNLRANITQVLDERHKKTSLVQGQDSFYDEAEEYEEEMDTNNQTNQFPSRSSEAIYENVNVQVPGIKIDSANISASDLSQAKTKLRKTHINSQTNQFPSRSSEAIYENVNVQVPGIKIDSANISASDLSQAKTKLRKLEFVFR